jgi:putative transposase
LLKTSKDSYIIQTKEYNIAVMYTHTQILKRKKIDTSITEENNCYENAMAERVNGILKDEFYLDQTFAKVAHAKRAAKNTIK